MAYSISISQAVSIMVYIAVKMKDGYFEFLTTKAISEKLNIANPTAVKILNNLATAGLVVTKEGAKGGVLLSKAPNEITLLDIFLAVEHDRPLFKTKFDFNIQSEQVTTLTNSIANCLLDAESEMKKSLQRTNLEDLIS